jgi:hypothetical protein
MPRATGASAGPGSEPAPSRSLGDGCLVSSLRYCPWRPSRAGGISCRGVDIISQSGKIQNGMINDACYVVKYVAVFGLCFLLAFVCQFPSIRFRLLLVFSQTSISLPRYLLSRSCATAAIGSSSFPAKSRTVQPSFPSASVLSPSPTPMCPYSLGSNVTTFSEGNSLVIM